MTRDELVAILRGITPVVREALATALDGLASRLKAVEDKAAVPGPAGERGLTGDRGAPGADGIDGLPGERGLDGGVGPAGPAGADGVAGPAGPQGERGAQGDRGERGIDGSHGQPGPQGERGIAGERGIDGLGVDDLDVVYDGQRQFSCAWTRSTGVQVLRSFSVPCTIYRGVYVEGKTYELGDMVTFGGCVWHANATTTVKPDESASASRAWTLAVKRGREGKTGRDGPRGGNGPKGEKGEPGPRW